MPSKIIVFRSKLPLCLYSYRCIYDPLMYWHNQHRQLKNSYRTIHLYITCVLLTNRRYIGNARDCSWLKNCFIARESWIIGPLPRAVIISYMYFTLLVCNWPIMFSVLQLQRILSQYKTDMWNRYSRPRHRRLEAFTTDAKIIRLISRRVEFFSKEAARHFFDGDFDAVDLKKISGVIPAPRKRDWRLPRWQNPAYAITLTVYVSSLSSK